ncbi:hypothetical protein ZWY2020_049754 [Hordeum vulgare]|nr:hypothetical protein ZWY2020_049754 [Hordeum vulgare]
MYIRVKRNKTTYFIQCDPTETILNIKQKLQSITDHPPNNQRLILLATNNILDDSKTLADQNHRTPIKNKYVSGLRLRVVRIFHTLFSYMDPISDFMASSHLLESGPTIASSQFAGSLLSNNMIDKTGLPYHSGAACGLVDLRGSTET